MKRHDLSVASIFITFFVAVPQAGAQTLWQDLHAGMSREPVERLHPTRDYPIPADCSANLDFRYTSGSLREVVLRGGHAIQTRRSEWDRQIRCRETVTTSLVARYGRPDVTRQLPGPTASRFDDETQLGWARDGIDIIFVARTNGPAWSIAYQLAQPMRPTATQDARERL